MAPLAPLCDKGLLLDHMRDRMSAVTVGAYRGIEISLAEHGVMDAFHGLGILVEMATPARFRRGDDEVPFGPECPLGMFVGREPEMAVRAAYIAVHGCLQERGVYPQRDGLAVLETKDHVAFMAFQAEVLFTGKALPL